MISPVGASLIAPASEHGSIMFKVRGRPAPQGSKERGATGQLREASRYLKPWREEVQRAAQRAMILWRWTTATVPCRSTIRFDVGWDPAGTPDLDKLVRGVHDALTIARVWADDDLAVELVASEQRVPPEDMGAWIRIDRLEGTEES